jgi:hypothetical protein
MYNRMKCGRLLIAVAILENMNKNVIEFWSIVMHVKRLIMSIIKNGEKLFDDVNVRQGKVLCVVLTESMEQSLHFVTSLAIKNWSTDNFSI